MKKKDNHNTVDIKVGAFMRAWVMNTYGTDCIKLDRDSNLWLIIKQHLDVVPKEYRPIEDKSEYISFVLLTHGQNTLAYAEPDPKHPGRQQIYVNTLYRCIISPKGENIIRRFLDKQFKNAFHNYMRGAMNNNPEISITDAITEFLEDSRQTNFDNKTIAALTKDWYRYRLKYPDEFSIPIFF